MVTSSKSSASGSFQPTTHDGAATAHCGYCGGADLRVVFFRTNRRYLRCKDCHAILQVPPIPPDDDPERHAHFAATIDYLKGGGPDYGKWHEFAACFRGTNLLEIGPGTGHFLAAARDAGFSVTGIEPDRHLREYVRQRWKIETSAELLEENALPAASFDNVVSFNCLEHIADPTAHVGAVERVLKPGGRFLVSTCNADCLVERIAGRYWSMIKEVTHFSIPAPESLRALGGRAGLVTVKLWCSERPLETPSGFALAVRDWLADLRHSAPPGRGASAAAGGRCASGTGGPGGSLAGMPLRRRALWRLIQARQFEWVAGLTSCFMLAGSLKALYEKPERDAPRKSFLSEN